MEYLADENAWLIANEGSGGAASSVWFYYALQNGELALMQGVTSESGAWYMTYDTDCDVSNDTPSDEAVCQAIIDSHTERYTALDYTPYTEAPIIRRKEGSPAQSFIGCAGDFSLGYFFFTG